MILDFLFALYIALLAVAVWLMWPRELGFIGRCRWCGQRIYEPSFAVHFKFCNPFNEHVSRCVVRAREAYRQRLKREGIDRYV